MQLHQFNQRGIDVFKELVDAERDKLDSPRKAAMVGEKFLSDVNAIAIDPDFISPIADGKDLILGIQFKDRYHMGEYLSQILPSDSSIVQYTNAGLWSWISAIYIKQLLQQQKKAKAWKLWSAYRYIPGQYQKFRYYRHLAFMSFWLHRMFGEEVAKFFLSRPVYAHSDALEQLYTQDRDFLASRGLMAAAVEMYIDPKTETMKRNALGEMTPGSARRLATKIAKQLQMNYDLQSMNKDEIYALLPSEFNSWRPNS